MNPYQVLGVDRDVDPATLKQAYRDKAKVAHPDAGGSEKAMAEVNQAYAVLADPDQRAFFDQTGQIIGAPAIDQELAGAMTLIANELVKLTMADESIFQADLIEYLALQLEKVRDKGQAAIMDFEKKEAKLRKMLGRFRVKQAGEPNRLEALLEERIGAAVAAKTRDQRDVDTYQRAITLLRGYTYTPETGLQYPYRGTAAGTTFFRT